MAADATAHRALSWSRLAGLLMLLLGWALQPVEAVERRAPRATDVEAAYLVNFLRYTQWPARCFASGDAPIVVTVVGSAEMAERVRAIAAAAGPIDGRNVLVQSLVSPRGSLDAPLGSQRDKQAAQLLRSSHLVFFHEGALDVHPRVLSDLWGAPVLTVGNAPGFTGRGGMLGLFRSGGNIVFEANPGAIRTSGLVVSAKVLKLARVAR